MEPLHTRLRFATGVTAKLLAVFAVPGRLAAP